MVADRRAVTRFVRSAAAAGGLALIVGATGGHPRAQQPTDAQQARVLQELQCTPPGDARTVRSAATGALRFVGTDAGRPIAHPRPLDAAGSPDVAARSYLSVCGSLFGVGAA